MSDCALADLEVCSKSIGNASSTLKSDESIIDGDVKTCELNNGLSNGEQIKCKNGLIKQEEVKRETTEVEEGEREDEARSNRQSEDMLDIKKETDSTNNHKEEMCALTNAGLTSDTKEFDDACFKTPHLPRKTSNAKRRPNLVPKVNGVMADEGEESAKTAESIAEELSTVQIYGEPSSSKMPCTCPFSKSFISTAYPNLPTHSSGDVEDEFLRELIIDEFSLIMFRTADDYQVIRTKETERKMKENAEAKKKQYHEDVRLGKIKKKGRKCKSDLEKGQTGAKKPTDDLKDKQKRKEERRRERMEREARGEKGPEKKESREEKEKRREERKRIKQQQKQAEKAQHLESEASTSHPSTSVLPNGVDPSIRSGSPSALSGTKRPASTISGNGVPSPIIPPSPKLLKVVGGLSAERNSVLKANTSESPTTSSGGLPIGINRNAVFQQSESAQLPLQGSLPSTSSVYDVRSGSATAGTLGIPRGMDFGNAFVNSPEFAYTLRNAIATMQAVDPTLIAHAQLFAANPLLLQQQQQQTAQGPPINAPADANTTQSSAGRSGTAQSVITSSATSRQPQPGTSAATSLAGVQFPPEAALASKLAGAAVFGTSSGNANRNAKKSRWCNMHVSIAHSIANRRQALSASVQPPARSSTAAVLSEQNSSSPTKRTTTQPSQQEAQTNAHMAAAMGAQNMQTSNAQSLNALQQSLYAQAHLANAAGLQLPVLAQQLMNPNTAQTPAHMNLATAQLASRLPLGSQPPPRGMQEHAASHMTAASRPPTSASSVGHSVDTSARTAAAAALHPALGLFGMPTQQQLQASQLALHMAPGSAFGSGGSITNGTSGTAQSAQQQMFTLLSQLAPAASASSSVASSLAGIMPNYSTISQMNNLGVSGHVAAAARAGAPMDATGQNAAVAAFFHQQLQQNANNNAARALFDSSNASMELMRQQFEASNAMRNNNSAGGNPVGANLSLQSGINAALEHEMRTRQLYNNARVSLAAATSTANNATFAQSHQNTSAANETNLLMEYNRQQQMFARAGFPMAQGASNSAALLNPSHLMGMNALMGNPLASAHLYGTGTKLPLANYGAPPKREG